MQLTVFLNFMRGWLFLLITYWLPFCAGAQIRVEVTQHAPFKTANQRLFFACDFNNWQPGNVEYELKPDANGVYSLNLPDSLVYFKYKITQGSWGLVEGDAKGNSRPDRIYDRLTEPNLKLLQLQIEGWEAHSTYRFVVTAIPDNTPKDATLYITGNFNNWNAGDENYRLRRQMDGTYRVTIVSDLERLEYKLRVVIGTV